MSNPGREKKKEAGYKKRIREDNLSKVMEMLGMGLSPRLIAHLIGIPIPTVKLWKGKYLD